MSYNLKYYPDPGIAFDISRMLFIKLNPPSVWQSALTTLDTQSDEIQYIENRAASLPAAPSELLLLSYLTPNRKSPLLSTIISKLIYEDFSSFSISILLDYFSNTKQIQKDIFTYYIGDHPLTSTDLERTIRLNKNIPNKLKLLLFGFMLNPISYITSFCDIIKTYYSIITEQWISDSSPEYIPSTFINYIIEKTYTADTHEISNLYTKTISYSLCFSTLLLLMRNFVIDGPFLITTNNTINHMLEHTESSETTSLINTTNALCDKNRIAIINYIVTNPNITLQQIVKELNLPRSTVTHHLSLLKKANIISSVRHGRIVLYSYNPQGFQNIINALKKIEKGGMIQ